MDEEKARTERVKKGGRERDSAKRKLRNCASRSLLFA